VVEDVAVVDVFNLLANAPRGLSEKTVIRYLRPVYKGNRFHIAKKQELVASLGREFVNVYRELMSVCAEHAGDFYDDPAAMRASIRARAAFENKPIDALYNYTLYQRLERAIAEYEATDNADVIREVIETTIARSLRKVERVERRREFFTQRRQGERKGAKKS